MLLEYLLLRETFTINRDIHRGYFDITRALVLEGTSKWSAKIAIKGFFLGGLFLVLYVYKTVSHRFNVVKNLMMVKLKS